MADSNSVELQIRAKNLTQDAFAQVVAALKEVQNESGSTSAAGVTLGHTFTSVGAEAMNARTSIAGLQGDLHSTGGAASAATDVFSHFKGAVAEAALGFVAGMATIDVAKEALSKVVEFVRGSIDAFSDLEAAQHRLGVAIQTQGTAGAGALQFYKDLGDEYTQTTAFSKDLITASEALFVQIGNVGPDHMKAALQAAMDLSAGLGIDLQSATMMVAKAFEGHITALQRYGFAFDQARVQAEGMTYVLDTIESKVGGQAQAELGTYAGQVKALGNAYQELQVSVGQLAMTGGMLPMAVSLAKAEIQDLTKGMQEFGKALADHPHNVLAVVAEYLALQAAEENVAKAGHDVVLALEGPLAAQRDYAKLITDLSVATPKLTDAQKEQALAAKVLGGNAAEVAKALHANEGAVTALFTAQDHASAMAQEYADALQKVRDVLLRVDLAKTAAEWETEIRTLGGSTALSAASFKIAAEEAAKLRDAGATLGPELSELAHDHDLLALAAQHVKSELDLESDAWKRWSDQVGASVQQVLAHPSHAAFDDSGNATRPVPIDFSKFPSALSYGFQTTDGAKNFFDSVPVREDDLTKGASNWDAELKNLGTTFTQLGSIAGGALGSIIRDMGEAQKQAAAADKDFSKMHDDFKNGDTGKGLLDAASGITAIGGAAVAAIKDVELVWNHFFGTAGRDAVGTFIATISGGYAGLQTQLAQLGPEGQQLWVSLTQGVGRNDAAGAAKAIQAVQAALSQLNGDVQKYSLTWKDLSDPAKLSAGFQASATALLSTFHELQAAGYSDSAIARQMGGDLDQLISDALTTGQQVPAALEPMLETFIRGGGLTDDLKNKLLGLTSAAAPSFANVQAAAQALGVNLDTLGPKVDQLRFTDELDADAKQLQVLQDAGANMGAVYDQMKGKMQDYVTKALQEGIQLPESIKPFIDQMISAGDLTDDLGNKLTDDSKLTWAKSLSDDVEDLVTEMKDLVSTIRDGVGGALDDVGNRHYSPTITPKLELPDGSSVDAGDGGAIPQHDDGAYIRRDHVAMVHSGEMIGDQTFFGPMIRSAIIGALGGSGIGADSGGNQIIQLQVDGQKLAQVLVRRIPAEIRRFGVKQ